MSTFTIVLVRHGESSWYKESRFCGWVDDPLTENGRQNAMGAGKALKKAGLTVDLAYTSVLQRSRESAALALEVLSQGSEVPIKSSWRLNERHYGELTGQSPNELEKKHGYDNVILWRRGYDAKIPIMGENHPFYDQIMNDRKYADVPKDQMPFAENLKQTFERTIPYWEEEIVPQIKAGKKILIYAHCNSLRSIVQHIDDLPDNEIVKLNIPPGIPFVYEFDEAMKPVVSMKFLDDEDKVKNMMASLAARGTKGGQLMPRFG